MLSDDLQLTPPGRLGIHVPLEQSAPPNLGADSVHCSSYEPCLPTCPPILFAVRNLFSTACRLPLIAWVVVCALVGCRSGPDASVIERELRWHEDQIYALEDYLMEYQAKVRRLRSENAMLAQALAETKQQPAMQDDSLIPEPSPSRSGANRSPNTFRPKSTKPQSETPSIGSPGDPSLKEPGIPPLKLESKTSSDSPEAAVLVVQTTNKSPTHSPKVAWLATRPQPSTIEPPTDKPLPAAAAMAPPPLAVEPNAPWAVTVSTKPVPADPSALGWIQPIEVPPAIVQASNNGIDWIDGTPWIAPIGESPPSGRDNVIEEQPTEEVNSPQTAPRQRSPIVLVNATPVLSYRPRSVLMEVELGDDEKSVVVQVTPLADDYQRAAFEGEVALMFRDPEARSRQTELARWVYTAEEVADAWVSTTRGRVLEFELPLLKTIPTEVPVELWVRMVPTNIEATSDDKATADETNVADEKILDHMVLRLESIHGPTRIEMGSDWAVATPGAPRLLEQPKATTSSQWRSTKATMLR